MSSGRAFCSHAMNVGSVASIAWDLYCGIRRIIVGCV